MVSSETPLDIEARIANMVRGSFKHGDYNPIQMGYFRPNDICSASRTRSRECISAALPCTLVG